MMLFFSGGIILVVGDYYYMLYLLFFKFGIRYLAIFLFFFWNSKIVALLESPRDKH